MTDFHLPPLSTLRRYYPRSGDITWLAVNQFCTGPSDLGRALVFFSYCLGVLYPGQGRRTDKFCQPRLKCTFRWPQNRSQSGLRFGELTRADWLTARRAVLRNSWSRFQRRCLQNRSGLSCHNVTSQSSRVFSCDSTMTMIFYVIIFIYSGRIDHKHCASLGSCFCFSAISQCKSTAGISSRPTECEPPFRYFLLIG